MRLSRQFSRAHRHLLAACSAAALVAVVGGCAMLPLLPGFDPDGGGNSVSRNSDPGGVAGPAFTMSSSYSGRERPESQDPDALPHPTEPERPASWHDDGVAGAVAAAQHFLEVQDFAFFSGNPIPVWRLAAVECVSCTDSIDEVWELGGMGQYAIFGEPVPQGEPLVEPDEELEDAWVVELEQVMGGVQRFNKYGDAVAEEPPGAYRTTWVTVAHADAKWQVYDVDYLEIN